LRNRQQGLQQLASEYFTKALGCDLLCSVIRYE